MSGQAGSARSASILVAAFVLSVACSAPSRAAEGGAFGPPPGASDNHAAADSAAPAPSPAEMQAPQAAEPAVSAAETTGSTAPPEDATLNTVAVSNDDSSAWDKASIIGKIFIACGTLLTLGSAARMFMI